MLIVNKDRLFLENVGAVKELSKVKFKMRNEDIIINLKRCEERTGIF